MRSLFWAVPVLTALVVGGLTGCASKGGAGAEEAAAAPVEAAGQGGPGGAAYPQGTGGRTTYQGRAWQAGGGPGTSHVIYFEYDSSEIGPEYVDIVRAHGDYLVANPRVSVLLEGHADERGSREYNIALGERRANAVQQMLILQGVPSGQIQIVSYGEEKPAAFGHDESSWAQNRRVEVLYSEL